jgi:hypothetical protein
MGPVLNSLACNLEELIAFTDYYLGLIDQDFIFQQEMNGVSRYLFNVSNDFFKKMHTLLQDPAHASSAVLEIELFKSEIATWIDRCVLFEKQLDE